MKAGKGCLTVIGGLVVLFIVIGVIAAATQKSSNGPTRSPALVTGSGNTGTSSKPKTPAHTQTFKGVGTENIGTINVATQSTLHWSCATCGAANFIISNSFNDNSQIATNASSQTHGQTVIDQGTFHDVQIETEGQGWTIRIVPGT
jgi:hypothetical protein